MFQSTPINTNFEEPTPLPNQYKEEAIQTLNTPPIATTSESVPQQYLELPIWVSYADRHHPKETFLAFVYSVLIPRRIRLFIDKITARKK